MSLSVNIVKNFSQNGFRLQVRFEAENVVTALLGASGCGKSLTLKCIAGIEKPDEGRIVLDGTVIFDSEKGINLSPQKRHVGYLFQNYALFPNMTVAQNIGVSMHGRKNRKIRRETVSHMIKIMYLEGLENDYPQQLSGGQQQRVALARILVTKPRILMLDEPFSALDSYLRWQMEQEIRRILAEFSGTTLFVSHNRDEVYHLCEQITVIDHGKVNRTGEKWDLFHDPQTYACCLLTGCKNISPARRVSEQTIETERWGIRLQTPKKVPKDLRYVGIRAHQFQPCRIRDGCAFPYEVVQTMQDTFSYILMVRPTERPHADLLRWEMNYQQYQTFLQDPPPFLTVACEDLLLLNR